jgi:glycerophosphoryl diester phosphodiesterase
MSSFRRAIELGAPWIELDVRSVEGTAVVYHDAKLHRLTECKRAISSLSIASLSSLTLPNGEKIPLLREVLSTFRGKVSLQIELKGAGAAEASAGEIFIALQSGWKPSELLVSSFDYEELALFKTLHPSIPVGLLIYGYPLNCIKTAKKFGATSVHINLDAVSEDRVNKLRENGFKVYVYTINDLSDISYLYSLGVDGIFTDYPDRVLTFTKIQS